MLCDDVLEDNDILDHHKDGNRGKYPNEEMLDSLPSSISTGSSSPLLMDLDEEMAYDIPQPQWAKPGTSQEEVMVMQEENLLLDEGCDDEENESCDERWRADEEFSCRADQTLEPTMLDPGTRTGAEIPGEEEEDSLLLLS